MELSKATCVDFLEQLKFDYEVLSVRIGQVAQPSLNKFLFYCDWDTEMEVGPMRWWDRGAIDRSCSLFDGTRADLCIRIKSFSYDSIAIDVSLLSSSCDQDRK